MCSDDHRRTKQKEDMPDSYSHATAERGNKAKRPAPRHVLDLEITKLLHLMTRAKFEMQNNARTEQTLTSSRPTLKCSSAHETSTKQMLTCSFLVGQVIGC